MRQTQKKLKNIKIIPNPARRHAVPSSNLEQAIYDAGYVKIAKENGDHRFVQKELVPRSSVINISGHTIQHLGDYEDYFASFGITREQLLNPENHIIFCENGTYKVDSIYEPTRKIHYFEIAIDKETGEIVEGKNHLEDYKLITADKAVIDSKEEMIVNVRELADYYAQKECEFYIRDFNLTKDFTKYANSYKKHYKQIIKFKTTTYGNA